MSEDLKTWLKNLHQQVVEGPPCYYAYKNGGEYEQFYLSASDVGTLERFLKNTFDRKRYEKGCNRIVIRTWPEIKKDGDSFTIYCRALFDDGKAALEWPAPQEETGFSLVPLKTEGGLYLPQFPRICDFVNSTDEKDPLRIDILRLISDWRDQERHIRILGLAEQLKGYNPDELQDAIDMLKPE